MNSLKLISRNLWYYRRPYLAVLTGVAISTAVLTGALMVGDSVRGSLVRLTEIRLGQTYWAIPPGDRYFRAELAGDLARVSGQPVVPALQVKGMGVNTVTGRRIQDLQVIGIDSAFGALWALPEVILRDNEAIISGNVAAKLELKRGDPLLIRLPAVGKVPSNAPFATGENPGVAWRVIVTSVAGDEEMGRFSLKSNQTAPFNVFVSLPSLSRRLDLPGSANLLLASGNEQADLNAEVLDSLLSVVWQLPDAGLQVMPLDDAGNVQISCDRVFFDDQTAQAIREKIPEAQAILTYLANDLSVNGKHTPYSFVAATENGIVPARLSPGEIVITDWLANDLDAHPGDSLTLTYYLMGPLRRLTEQETRFLITRIIPLASVPFGTAMMPDFPGMSNAGNCRDWETGTPVDLGRIRDKDEDYWNRFRGTPKAFISLEDGEQIWTNPFGTVTAFRFQTIPITRGISPSGTMVPESIGHESTWRHPSRAGSEILSAVKPSWRGLTFRPVREEGILAAKHSTDFGGLFLSLSVFLLVAALLLTILLFSLHAGTRRTEVGVLSAVGFRKPRIIRILLAESLVVAVVGVLLGSLAGILYNKLVLFGLSTLWQDAVRTSHLQGVVRLTTLVTGAVTLFIATAGILFFTLRRQLRRPVSGLVKGLTNPLPAPSNRAWKRWLISGIMLTVIAVLLLVFKLAGGPDPDPTLFLLAGGMLLAGGILLTGSCLSWQSGKTAVKVPGFSALVWKNLSLKRSRSLAAISLLALGTFTVIITGANRKTFYGAENDRSSGTGGFLFWIETTLPLLVDLNTPMGKAHVALEDEMLLKDIRFMQFHKVEGDDVSCLNLNKVSHPLMLGVPVQELDRLGAFRLVSALPEVNQAHPWLALERELSPGVIPAIVDQTILTWGLQKQVGDTLWYRDETGHELRVKLMGGLDNSIFQGYILISERHLRRYYPSVSGSCIMLAEGPFRESDQIASRLEELFVDYGLTATRASERLAEFNSVENTYLSIFMLLGALGVLIGTVGLGGIIVRNTLERKPEFGIYLAMGFRRHLLLRLIMAENLFILVTGMGIGCLSALAGIMPSFMFPEYTLPVGTLLILLALIFINGGMWIYLTAKHAGRQNLVQVLRNE